MELRNIAQNFVIKQETYDKLCTLASEKGYENRSVFVTQKIILAYSRRIDRSRLDAGKIAKEPLARRVIRLNYSSNVKVHLMLTGSEKKALSDVIKYHNFIDKYGRPEYSMFLACAIEKMWGERDEIKAEKPKEKPNPPVDYSILNPNL